MVQVREKQLNREELRILAKTVIEATGDSLLVSINSDVALAVELQTNVHLPEAGCTERERTGLNELALVGRSIHAPYCACDDDQLDYLMLGNLFETASKPGKPGLGTSGFEAIVRTSRNAVIAIGGIQPDNVAEARAAGAYGVAVSSYVNSAADPARATYQIRRELDKWTT